MHGRANDLTTRGGFLQQSTGGIWSRCGGAGM